MWGDRAGGGFEFVRVDWEVGGPERGTVEFTGEGDGGLVAAFADFGDDVGHVRLQVRGGKVAPVEPGEGRGKIRGLVAEDDHEWKRYGWRSWDGS